MLHFAGIHLLTSSLTRADVVLENGVDSSFKMELFNSVIGRMLHARGSRSFQGNEDAIVYSIHRLASFEYFVECSEDIIVQPCPTAVIEFYWRVITTCSILYFFYCNRLRPHTGC